MKNVLLVDDEKVIRKGIKKLLEDVITGYKVMWEASNGCEALEIANIEVPDLVITDIRMPEMNGIDFISYFKKRHPLVSVIVISGHDDFIYVREALKLGVKDYLLKPISRSDLASILQNINNEYANSDDVINPGESINISKIKDIIRKNLEKEITLNFISNTLNLHPNYISQLFKRKTNIKLSEYIMQQRIDKSKELLTQTQLKIYDIAHLVGYVNSKHFSVVFKKVVGKTPYQYRQGI
ncbi:response regulator transcription factor [Sporosarcina limicola]|uniref:Two-component system response regulator YesN n=1 Tax=Sporosarcina limicola TaxID=34101 RepID=A0A927MH59_9BACL|nr:response regulator [Sporosarcina limicola]MBE1554540.1 two-component system response regulator YesN [Sporosarcina limicola]